MYPFLPLWFLDFVSFLILELLIEGKNKKRVKTSIRQQDSSGRTEAGKGERVGVTAGTGGLKRDAGLAGREKTKKNDL